MTQVPQTLDSVAPSLHPRLMLALPFVAGLLAVLAIQNPVWTFLAIMVAAVTFAVAKWPEASTLTVVFILYSNIAAIAVEFHGVPLILSASFFLLLAIPLFYHIVMRREKIIVQPTLLLLILFVMVQLVGTVSALHPDIASRELLTSLTEGALLYFLIINVVRTQQTLRRVIWTLVAAGMLMSLAPLYQQMTGQFDNNLGGFGQVSNAAFAIETGTEIGPVQPRMAGSVGEQNRFAQVLLMLLPLALFRWWGESTSHWRMLAALATGLITGAIILTFSRGAAVGFLVILTAMVALRYIPVQRLSLILLFLVVAVIAVPHYGARIAKLQALWTLVDSENTGQSGPDGSMKSRMIEMGAAGLVFLDHPLVGVGPGMFRYHYREYAEQVGLRVFTKSRQSHSIIPGLAAETGLLGLFLFTAIMLITVRDLVRAHGRWKASRPDQANVAASFVLVVIAYMTTAMFLHLAYVRYFWLMMALASVASRVGDHDASSAATAEQEQT